VIDNDTIGDAFQKLDEILTADESNESRWAKLGFSREQAAAVMGTLHDSLEYAKDLNAVQIGELALAGVALGMALASEHATAMAEIKPRAGMQINPDTGEIMVMHDGLAQPLTLASDEALAGAMIGMEEARHGHKNATALVEHEILKRMDRDLCWTIRCADEDGLFELKGSSPTAGSVIYPAERLEAALRELVSEGLITEGAADQACERRAVVEFSMPWELPNEAVEGMAGQLSIEIDGFEGRSVAQKVMVTVKPRQAGLNKLAKIPKTTETIEKARVTVEPKRSVRVTRL
jgi:hypothetical protein